MANTPTVAQYKAQDTPICSNTTGKVVWPGGGVYDRILVCLTAFITGTNPDGTVRGT